MQHYIDPNSIAITERHPRWPNKKLKETLTREGQIVPLLVHRSGNNFWVDDFVQAERLMALQELGWSTVLCEDNWTPDDL